MCVCVYVCVHMCSSSRQDALGRLRFHYDNDNEYENEIIVC